MQCVMQSEKQKLIFHVLSQLYSFSLMVLTLVHDIFLKLFCQQGGCVDSRHQSLALLYMILGQRDVSKLLTGPLTPYT